MISKSHFLIVEDELLIAETISDYLKQEGCQNISIVTSVDEAIECINNNSIDLVLSDIVLIDDKTGIDLGEMLTNKYKIPFIYITSHADKSIVEKAKLTKPSGYIVKPFKKEDIIVSIELALYSSETTHSTTNNEILVKEGRAIVKLLPTSILWIESDKNYSTIYLNDKSRKVIRQSLQEIHDSLPQNVFIRIHKSYVVNKNHVSQINSNFLIIDKTELPIGRAYQSSLAASLNLK